MNVYRTVWLSVVGAAAVTGMGLGLVVWPAAGVVVLFGIAALSAGAMTISHLGRVGGPPIARAELVWVATTHACAAGTCVVAAVVLGQVVGPLILPVLMLVAATSPWCVKFVGARLVDAPATHGHPGEDLPATGRDEIVVVSAPVATLSDRELCRIWRVTFASLQEARSPVARERIVSQRQACIDELDVRYPGAISAWLASGPRASGSPDRFLA